jgi:hypothetical protein
MESFALRLDGLLLQGIVKLLAASRIIGKNIPNFPPFPLPADWTTIA